MIDQLAVQTISRAGETTGSHAISLAWRRIAARVIVCEEQAPAARHRRVGNDRSHWKPSSAGVALMTRQSDALQSKIDMRNPQALSSWIGLVEAVREESASRLQSVQLERLGGTPIAHPS